MHIIPVIDLLNGVVVHAKKGARQHYHPIQSQLTQSHQPLDIVKALLDVYPFTQLYIADLNAIQKLNSPYASNLAIIETIQARFPQLTLWLDAGINCNTELNAWCKLKAKLVLGSESFANINDYVALTQVNKDFVLSLDFFAEGYRGPEELLKNCKFWPKDVIVMSLANVGANTGVNSWLLNSILTKAEAINHYIYAAGGVRNADDLILLKSLGVKGTLIASAIHQLQITSDEIEKIFNPY